jgi:ERCC4-type nuclease
MLVGPQKWGGKWSPVKLGSQQFLYAELAQFLTSIRTGTKCRVVQTEDEEGTIREVLTLVKWFGKPWHQHKSLHAFQDNTPEISRFGRPSLGARWAFQLAGIGPDRAIAVGKLCDSAEDICFLTEKQLTAIEGIGPVLAKSILDQIRKKRSPKVK